MNRGNKKQAQHIPQQGQKLRELREKLDKTQAEMADLLEAPLKPHMGTGFTIQQSDISRLEREESILDVPRMLAYAHQFNVDIGTLLKPHFQSLCKSEMRLQHFPTDAEADQYLCEMENKGRILAFSHLPSSFFLAETSSPRFQQITQANYAETHFYTLDALLNFLFSPISRYDNAMKISTLDKYLGHFRRNFAKRLRFFSRASFPRMSRFPNLELLPEKSTLIMLAPVMQYDQGDVLLEIRSETICQEVFNFYSNVKTLDADVTLIKIGREALELIQQGSSIEQSVRFFYQEVVKRSPEDGEAILENFNADMRPQLSQ
ncbi:MAG: helix-turn-helix transcriptional regulator [Thiothrix sp.]|uniref:helix-turn-helix domain-containing protein n=1 Tax=Thiothrix sp. TaxID=1032 RepID=UPI00262F1510|nr:helix-turn-helix transcriptional regulator [Thiothrix sp.]MDD5391997.1 helix-turn-helix transcriptional regulator [Thiothrix sp.]